VEPAAKTEVKKAPAEKAEPAPACEPLFAQFTDEELASIGVPEDRLALIREIRSRQELSSLQAKLPSDAFESLVWLADGESLEEVRSAYRNDKPTQEWEQAVRSERSQRSFRVVEDDADMERIVGASLERWRVFLHPSQKRIVENPAKTPMLVRGAAGTGKTVVAMHRAVSLVQRNDWPKGKKLLFTTFTNNLAIDIQHQLRCIATPEELNRIEVQNIDAWVSKFLKRKKIARTVVYPDSQAYEECWTKALLMREPDSRFTESFLREEWQRVILPQEINSERDYLRASRKGRGVSLSRNDRKEIWPIFEDMREELGQNNLITTEDAGFMAASILEQDPAANPYAAVVVDETQDMGEHSLKLLARIAKGDEPQNEPWIFLCGDGQQRIYSRTASLSACGINVRGRRSSRLKLTYRTTEEIRLVAEKVLAGREFDDMDGEAEKQKGLTANRHGAEPVVYAAQNFDDEVAWIAEQIDSLDRQNFLPSDICIVTRTNSQVEAYSRALAEKGFEPSKIARGQADTGAKDRLRIATMHRVKGLEFKAVFIAGASEGRMPLKARTEDPVEIRQSELTERSLFYVAASRARDVLFVSCDGEPGAFLKSLRSK
jgi:superfamily I DNA/RNA helicase